LSFLTGCSAGWNDSSLVFEQVNLTGDNIYGKINNVRVLPNFKGEIEFIEFDLNFNTPGAPLDTIFTGDYTVKLRNDLSQILGNAKGIIESVEITLIGNQVLKYRNGQFPTRWKLSLDNKTESKINEFWLTPCLKFTIKYIPGNVFRVFELAENEDLIITRIRVEGANAKVYLGLDTEDPIHHLYPTLSHTVRETWQIISDGTTLDTNIKLQGPHTFVCYCTNGSVTLNGELKFEEVDKPNDQYMYPEREYFEQL